MRYLTALLLSLMISCGGSNVDYIKEIDNCFAMSIWAKNYPTQSKEVIGCLTSSRACVNACQAYSSECTSYSEMVVNYCKSLPEYKMSNGKI